MKSEQGIVREEIAELIVRVRNREYSGIGSKWCKRGKGRPRELINMRVYQFRGAEASVMHVNLLAMTPPFLSVSHSCLSGLQPTSSCEVALPHVTASHDNLSEIMFTCSDI